MVKEFKLGILVTCTIFPLKFLQQLHMESTFQHSSTHPLAWVSFKGENEKYILGLYLTVVWSFFMFLAFVRTFVANDVLYICYS